MAEFDITQTNPSGARSTDPVVVQLPNGNVLVGWQRFDTNDSLGFRLFQSDGTPISNEFNLTTTFGDGRISDIHVVDNSKVIVTYSDFHSTTFRGTAEAVPINIVGNVISAGAAVTLSNPATDSFGDVQVEGLANGNLVFVWSESDASFTTNRVVALTTDANLTTITGITQVSDRNTPSSGGIHLVTDGNQATVGWTQNNIPNTFVPLLAKSFTINANGTIPNIGGISDIQVRGNFSTSLRDVKTLANGDIAFLSTGSATGTGDELFVKIYRPGLASVAAAEFQVNQNVQPTGAALSELVPFAGGGFAVIYAQEAGAGEDFDIWYRAFDNTYTAAGNHVQLHDNANDVSDSRNDATLLSDDGDLFFVWARDINNGDEFLRGEIIADLDPNPVVSNNAPEVNNVFGETAEILVGNAKMNVDVFDDADVSDVDSPNFEGGSLLITQTGGPVDGSWLSGNPNISYTQGFTFTNGSSSATLTNNFGASGAPLEWTFGAGWTAEDTEALLDSFGYSAPTEGTRTFSLTLDDGDGGDSDVTGSFTINVTIDDAPTLTATGNDPDHQPGTPSDLFDTVVADTIEAGQTFTSLTLMVSNLADGPDETLAIDGDIVALTDGTMVASTATNGLAVDVSVLTGTATVTVSGSLTETELQTLVDDLSYNNASADPTLGARTVTITQIVDSGSNAAPSVNTTNPNLQSTAAVAETPGLIVTTTADVVDRFDGETSLREAIDFANSNADASVITFASGAGEAFENDATIRLTLGEIEITEELTINGSSAGGDVVITGDAADDDVTLVGTDITDVAASYGGTPGAMDDYLDDNSRLFHLSGFDADTTFDDLILTGGRTTGNGSTFSGGAVYSPESLARVTNSTVSGNSTAGTDASGGAIYIGANGLTIIDSTVSNNSTAGENADGGGLRSGSGPLILNNSTVSGNFTEGDNAEGGGLHSLYVVLTNSAVTGNSTKGGSAEGGGVYSADGMLSTGSTVTENFTNGNNSDGGGIWVMSNLSLTNSTVSGNSTYGDGSDGGGIWATEPRLINSTVSGNSTTGSSSDGGGLVSTYGELFNSTVSGNSTAGLGSEGGGVVNRNQLSVTSSLILGNLSAQTAEDDLFDAGGSTPTQQLRGNIVGDTFTFDGASPVTGITAAQVFAATQVVTVGAGSTTAGVLADNGGPVETLALLASAVNPALDAGTSALLTDATGNDRTIDLPGVGNDGMGFADLGAFELQALSDLTVSLSPSSIQENGGTATGTVTRSGDTSTALVVSLNSSDTSEATVPATVTIGIGNASATFTVNAVDDGVIDGDQPVTITATGPAINPGTGVLTVIENRPPTIALDPATLTVPEDTDVTSRVKVADVVIADDGIGTNILTMRGPDAGAFELDGTELFIKAGARLDFELESELNIFVDVDDPTLGGARDDTQEFILTLTDVNEPPEVALTNVAASLPEDTDTSVRIKVADIVVTDDALGSETLALSGADAALFEIDGIGLYLKAGAALDFETDPGFDVTVEVDDASVGTTPDDAAALLLAVTDVNEPPSVALVNVTPGVPETPFLAGRIKVADIVIIDDALGAETLSLSGADALSFQLDGLELYLRAGRPYDFETMPVLNVSVDVNDAALPGTPDGSAPLVFPILDVNEAPSLALANVLAGLPEDTDNTERVKVADIVITDDVPGTNTLALTGPDAGLFEIDGTELFLKAGTMLDFESDPQLDVTVTLDDPDFAGLEGSAPVALAVTDVNEPPMVALANVVLDLSEDTDTTTRIKVADIVITDDALGTNTLGLSGADAGLFEIDGSELFLIAGAALDFETNPALDVTVTISNPEPDGTPDDTAELTIAIGDVNEAPSLALENVISDLAEDTDTATRVKVADIVVNDDALGTNTLALTGADAALFEIDGLGLFLKASTALDFESDPQLDVSVTLDDAEFAGLEGSEELALAITDVDELPTVALLNALAGLAEDTDTSTRVKVADIDITDDALGSAMLGLAGTDAALFEIEATELFLKAGTVLDFETDAELDVVVTVDDPALGADPDDSDALALAVTDVNEAPSLALANVLAGLPEDTDTTTRVKVADIVVNDDALGTNTLALNGADASLFEIDGAELFLKAGTALDFETVPQLDVTVTLDDPDFAGLEGSEAVTLAITNANEPPMVALSNVVTALTEDTDTTARIKIADIDVTDDGLGNQSLGLAGANDNLFEIDGTELFLKAGTLLDFETGAALDVTVTIDDLLLAADPDDSAALTVAVTDVNEAPSLDVTQDVTTLTDDSGTTARLAVAALAILDDALGSNAITLSGDDAVLFEVDGGTLYLKAGVVLDGGTNPVLDVAIELDDATLGTGVEDSVALMIEVADTDQMGTSGDDLLIGTPFVDGLFGFEGDDTLVGRESDDVLDGGAGDGDVAVFQAPQSSYTITLSPGGTTVADRTLGGTGADTVIDIETLRFSSDPLGNPETGTDLDLTLFEGVLDVTAVQLASLTHLYIGLYNRAPDALGLFYWATQLADGLGFDEITQYFIDSPEAIALYGATPTNTEIVEGAYGNLLDRASDPLGAAFWTALLDLNVITPASFFELFVAGAEANPNAGADRTTLTDQEDISLYYAVIQGLSDAADATTALDTYDLTDRAASLIEAQDLIDSYAATAMGTGSGGELLVQVMGVIDDPFV